MKEITRKLYTKPVMLGLALLLGMVVLTGLFVTTKSTAAVNTFIPEGDDKFETTANGETYHNFAASKIPANFFGPTSNEYTGVVPLVGVPLPNEGDIDTVIHRNAVWAPGTTSIKMTKLSLRSINPIIVTYGNGSPSEQWEVSVSLSTLKESTGTMTFSATTFDSSLKVWPKFTFRRLSDNTTLVLDTGDPNGPGLTAASETAIAGDSTVFEPAPAPTIAPCPIVVGEFEPVGGVSDSATTSASTSGCSPVTLTSSNSPWTFCNGVFCIPRPLTEAELLAAHNASPPGTKKRQLAAKAIAVAE